MRTALCDEGARISLCFRQRLMTVRPPRLPAAPRLSLQPADCQYSEQSHSQQHCYPKDNLVAFRPGTVIGTACVGGIMGVRSQLRLHGDRISFEKFRVIIDWLRQFFVAIVESEGSLPLRLEVNAALQ